MDLPDLAHPERLWWLLALPILYLLSLPPTPRARVLTAHLRQWRLALAKLRRQPVRFRRLRFWLMMLAASATILAASQPSLAGREGPSRLVILLDDSASMAAAEAGEDSAWRQARALLETQLSQLPQHVSLQLALSSDARISRGSPAEILAALPAAPAGEPRVSFVELASSLVSQDQVVWTISDGRDPRTLPAVGAFSLVAKDLRNRGLIGCRIEDRWPLPEIEITIEVGDFGYGQDQLQLEIRGGGGPSTFSIRLDRGRGEAVLQLARGPGGMVLVSLRGTPDGLPVDDQLQLWLPPPPAPDIALLSRSESSLWLRKAAEVLASESGGQVLTESLQRPDFMLVEGGWLQQPWGRGISFGTGFGDPKGAAKAQRQGLQVLDWNRNDPVTRGLDFSDLRIERALAAEFLPAGDVLLWGTGGALMVLAGAGASRSLHIAFQLADSNLPLLPAFPQLLRRAFARCYGDQSRARLATGNLLSASESDLHLMMPRPLDRPLPAFGLPGTSLSVPLLLLALLALAGRVYA